MLARALYDWQQQSFDPAADPYYAGQDVWDSDLDKSEVLTGAKAAEWNAKFEAFCAAHSDQFDPVPPELPMGAFCIAELDSPSFEDFAAAVVAPTRALFDCLGWTRILMIGISRAAYLEQENEAPEVAAAENRLLAAGLSRDYAGAIAADPDTAAQFLANFFWIARCNAAAPYLYVSAPAASTLLVLCKYGNYHVETYTGGEAPEVEAALLEAGFTLASDGICEERFSETGAIADRKLPV